MNVNVPRLDPLRHSLTIVDGYNKWAYSSVASIYYKSSHNNPHFGQSDCG